MMIYLDNAAATPLDKRVLKVMEPYYSDLFYNPSAAYLPARHVRADLEEARHQLAQIIGARSAEIIITAGATESDNVALAGVSGKIITLSTEHLAVLDTTRARQGLILPVDRLGRVNLSDLASAIDDNTELISIGYVNSETGMVQDLKSIADLAKTIRSDRMKRGVKLPLLIHTDASQAAGLFDLNVARLGIDLMTLNAGKCYGPKQVGLLYIKAGVVLRPMIHGGGQEMGLRSGTENVTGIIGFAKALELAEKTRKSEFKRLSGLRNKMIKRLSEAFPELIINQNAKANSPAIINFSVPGLDGERAVFALDERGIMVATGSACAANKGLRSHVLVALGLDPIEADGSIRISMGRFTTEDDSDQASQTIVEVIRQQLKFGVHND